MRETPKAVAAFLQYCELGTGRTLESLYQFYQKQPKTGPNGEKTFRPTLGTLKAWSSQLGWQARVAEWERQQSITRQTKKNAEREAMDARHAQIATREQAVAIQQIEVLKNSGNLGATATVQLLKIALDAERVARGAPTEIHNQEHSGPGGGPIEVANNVRPDLDLLTDEEFEQLERINRLIKERKEKLANADRA